MGISPGSLGNSGIREAADEAVLKQIIILTILGQISKKIQHFQSESFFSSFKLLQSIFHLSY
jgi:hypothetical protein